MSPVPPSRRMSPLRILAVSAISIFALLIACVCGLAALGSQVEPTATAEVIAAEAAAPTAEPPTFTPEPVAPATKKTSVERPASPPQHAATSEAPTATPESPTATPEPPTATSEPPTVTPEPPTVTPEPPTATPAPAGLGRSRGEVQSGIPLSFGASTPVDGGIKRTTGRTEYISVEVIGPDRNVIEVTSIAALPYHDQETAGKSAVVMRLMLEAVAPDRAEEIFDFVKDSFDHMKPALDNGDISWSDSLQLDEQRWAQVFTLFADDGLVYTLTVTIDPNFD